MISMDTKRAYSSLDDIFEATWKAAGPDPMIITALNPGRAAAVFKHAGIYIARQQGHTFKDIAHTFNLKSHASAIHAFNRIKDNQQNDMVMVALSRILSVLHEEGDK